MPTAAKHSTITKETAYPFGMLERSYSDSIYRFGFNGKENDNEILGNGRWQDYGQRLYRPDLIRFFTPDPLIVYQKKYPELSSYQFASNTPIMAIDMDGLERAVVIISNGEDGKTNFTIITDRNVIENLWKGLSVAKDNIVWDEGEWRYKYYAEGSKTNSYYPPILNNEGILILDQRSEKTKLSYVQWEEDHKLNQEQKKQNAAEQINNWLRVPGRKLQVIGAVIEIGGVILAPFTDGASLVLVEVGAVASLTGTTFIVVADIAEGQWEEVAEEVFASIAMGGVLNYVGKTAKNNLNVESDNEWLKDYIYKKIKSIGTIIEEATQLNEENNNKEKQSDGE